MTDDVRQVDLAERHLTVLHGELLTRGIESEVVKSGFKPRLRIGPVIVDGWGHAAFEDNVVAAQTPEGIWWYWWPWIEKLGPASDPGNVARLLADEFAYGAADGDILSNS
jgi:hypothetical protein